MTTWEKIKFWAAFIGVLILVGGVMALIVPDSECHFYGQIATDC